MDLEEIGWGEGGFGLRDKLCISANTNEHPVSIKSTQLLEEPRIV